MFRALVCCFAIAVGCVSTNAGPLDAAIEAYEHKQFSKSAKLYEEQALGGNAEAQYRLGSQYDLGEGLPADLNEALKWYRLSARQNHPKAQTRLGQLYRLGRGVPKDVKAAADLFRKAAFRGDAEAQQALGQLYYEGTGVRRDYRQSANWLHRAAQQGDTDAQSLLGTLYAEGKGVRRDIVQAYVWKGLAGRDARSNEPSDDLGKGLAEARRQINIRARDELGGQMTPRQLAQAQSLLAKWQPKPERQL